MSGAHPGCGPATDSLRGFADGSWSAAGRSILRELRRP